MAYGLVWRIYKHLKKSKTRKIKKKKIKKKKSGKKTRRRR